MFCSRLETVDGHANIQGQGDANDKGNYRPISVIWHIAKIIEREITNQVLTYLESNNLLTSDQSAYCAQHSTAHRQHYIRLYMIGYIILPLAYIRLFARSIYAHVLTPSIILC